MNIFENQPSQVIIVGLVFYFVLAIVMAFIPISIAKAKHPSDNQLTAIKVLSILGIITFGFLWLVALVWAICLPSNKPASFIANRGGSKARPGPRSISMNIDDYTKAQ